MCGHSALHHSICNALPLYFYTQYCFLSLPLAFFLTHQSYVTTLFFFCSRDFFVSHFFILFFFSFHTLGDCHLTIVSRLLVFVHVEIFERHPSAFPLMCFLTFHLTAYFSLYNLYTDIITYSVLVLLINTSFINFYFPEPYNFIIENVESHLEFHATNLWLQSEFLQRIYLDFVFIQYK